MSTPHEPPGLTAHAHGAERPRPASNERRETARPGSSRQTPRLGSTTTRRTRKSRPAPPDGRSRHALKKLLRREDRNQACRARQPQPDQRHRVARHRPLPARRAPQASQEPADRKRHQHHEPRNQRMQIRVARALQHPPQRPTRTRGSSATDAPRTPQPASTSPVQRTEAEHDYHRARSSQRHDTAPHQGAGTAP